MLCLDLHVRSSKLIYICYSVSCRILFVILDTDRTAQSERKQVGEKDGVLGELTTGQTQILDLYGPQDPNVLKMHPASQLPELPFYYGVL